MTNFQRREIAMQLATGASRALLCPCKTGDDVIALARKVYDFLDGDWRRDEPAAVEPPRAPLPTSLTAALT